MGVRGGEVGHAEGTGGGYPGVDNFPPASLGICGRRVLGPVGLLGLSVHSFNNR